MSKFTRALSLSLAILLVLSLTLVGTAQEEKIVRTSFLSGDVPSLDPAIATDSSSIQVITELFPGLTRLHEETLELDPGVTSGWTVSDDGLTYTFDIIEGIAWVWYNPDSGEVEQVLDEDGNVRMLTAHDFVFGMRRTLDPTTAGDYAYIPAGWLENGNAVWTGEAGLEELSVQAIDDYTLELRVTQPAGFIPNILGLWMFTAQPEWLIEVEGDFWTEGGIIQSFGPFAMAEWNHGESILIVTNPFWEGTASIPAPTIDGVHFSMLEESAQLANFEAGTLDVADFPVSEIDRLSNHPGYNVVPGTGVYYYGFNVTKEPFTNANIRRAFSMAIDRQDLIDNVLKAGQFPANFFTPASMSAAPDVASYPDLAIGFNPTAAQEALAAGLAEMGLSDVSELPAITLTHNESESHRTIAEAIQNMWSEHLGVEVQITSMEWASYLDILSTDSPQVYRIGWGADYPDAHNFLFDVLSATSDNNYTNWVNEEYEALLDEARGLTDIDARRELYAQAEHILVNQDAAIAPIYHTTSYELTQPWVERTYSRVSAERFEKWDLGARD